MKRLYQFPIVQNLLLCTAVLMANSVVSAQEDEQREVAVPVAIEQLLQNHCIDCHGADEPEAGLRLDLVGTRGPESRAAVLNLVHEALYLEEMPPKTEAQPSDSERKQLVSWVRDSLKLYGPIKLDEKLQRQDYGNYVNHDKLFSGEYTELKGFTYDRRWLVSQYIFDAKLNRILNHKPNQNIDAQRQRVFGSNNRRVNLTNPFLLPTNSGVRYYANESLNGGHLLTMLTNAKEVSEHMMYLAGRDKRYLPAINALMALEDKHRATLASRERFLKQHIEPLLEKAFSSRHEELLPVFEPVNVVDSTAKLGDTKKAPFHAANPGKEELVLLFRSMRRHKKSDQTDEQLIEACEREWFYHGHDNRKIQARITFLQNYMSEWLATIKQHRYDEKHKPIIYRSLPEPEMEIIRNALLEHRQANDRFFEIIDKCMRTWRKEFSAARVTAGLPPKEEVETLVEEAFAKILEREPDETESREFAKLTFAYIQNLGRQRAIEKLIQTLILNTEFVYRNEFGSGQPDRHGRTMLGAREASFALSYALTDSSPDEELALAAREGRLQSRVDYEREIRRMLARRDLFYIVDEAVHRPNDLSSFTNMPIRELRFFREFFGYAKLLPIFKDNKRFGANYDHAKKRLVSEADRLVEFILERDQNVIEELLTTDEFYVFHSGDNEAMNASSVRIQEIYDYFKDLDWENFTLDDLATHKDFIAKVKMRGIDVSRLQKDRRYNPLGSFKKQMESFTLRLDNGQRAAAPYNSFPAHGMANAPSRYGGRFQSPEVAKFFNIEMAKWNYETRQPAKLPRRKGMLTHPAWLISFSHNTETDPIRRGKWIREKLLAGTIPDLPITVDAVIPEDSQKTLRQRLESKTNKAYCWQCHQKMEPLGLAFEMYDDFGRARTEERLEYPENLLKKVKDKGAVHEDLRDVYKTLPVSSQGELKGTGDPDLDGKVGDALELIERLGKSDRVRQSIIRYAFRYFLGHNEMLSDSKTLIDAEKAYLDSGGSFDELIVSLLTSDSFIYRKPQE
jgi:hypothetical protein